MRPIRRVQSTIRLHRPPTLRPKPDSNASRPSEKPSDPTSPSSSTATHASTSTPALALEPELQAAGGQWFEEPVDPVENSDDLRTIHEHANLPIAGGEHAYGVNLFKRLVEEDILDIVMPDVKFCGGPVEAYRIGTELEPAYPGSVSMHCPSGPLSLLASAHATIAFENTLPLEHGPVYEVDWRHELLEPYERVENGHLIIPKPPG